MPNQNSTIRSGKRTKLFAALALLLCTAATGQAALQDAPSDDWSSSFFSTYGFVLLLFVVLVALIGYKRISRARENAGFEPVEPLGQEQASGQKHSTRDA